MEELLRDGIGVMHVPDVFAKAMLSQDVQPNPKLTDRRRSNRYLADAASADGQLAQREKAGSRLAHAQEQTKRSLPDGNATECSLAKGDESDRYPSDGKYPLCDSPSASFGADARSVVKERPISDPLVRGEFRITPPGGIEEPLPSPERSFGDLVIRLLKQEVFHGKGPVEVFRKQPAKAARPAR